VDSFAAGRALVKARRALVAGSTILLLAAAPTAAVAKGWTLQLRNHIGKASTRTTAKHCGTTKFGTWSFRATITLEGRIALARWKTLITQDGAPHPTTGVTVTGSAPKSAKTTLKQTFSTIKFRYAAGAPPKLRTELPDGSTYSTLTFRPTPIRRC
jgi:hypothetical protein